jgi:hypothetical protein
VKGSTGETLKDVEVFRHTPRKCRRGDTAQIYSAKVGCRAPDTNRRAPTNPGKARRYKVKGARLPAMGGEDAWDIDSLTPTRGGPMFSRSARDKIGNPKQGTSG